jgi:hypothetical protein
MTDSLKQEIVNFRELGGTLSEIAEKFKISKSSASLIVREVKLSDKAKELIKVKKANSVERAKGNEAYKNTEAFKKRQLLSSPKLELPKAKSFELGSLGEKYAEYILLRKGLQVFKPSTILQACDLLVYNGTKYFRCEVKSSRTDDVKCTRSLYEGSKQLHSVKYIDKDNIDVFIFVQLTDELIAFAPFEAFKGVENVKFSGVGKLSKYVNNFEVFYK